MTEDKKIQDLDRYVKDLSEQVRKLTTRVNYLERENSRRKSEMSTMSHAINQRK